jgi:hypothetical protein
VHSRGIRIISRPLKREGRVAQLVERGIENPCVGGSSPPLATFLLLFALTMVAACGDSCESLCDSVSQKVSQCMDTGMTWQAYGAVSREEYAQECREQWTSTLSSLGSHEADLAFELCRVSQETLDEMTCKEVRLTYVAKEKTGI